MIIKSNDVKSIEFVATVYKVQTLADNGLRVTIDLSEDDILKAAQLMECHRIGIVLKFVAVPSKSI